MAISNFSRQTAFEFVLSILRQASPSTYLGDASELRHLFAMPMGLINAGIFGLIDELQLKSMANADLLSDQDVDELASNFISSPRSSGTRANVTVRVYLRQATSVTINSYPYFSSVSGGEFSPAFDATYTISDVRTDDQGRLYIDVPCLATAVGSAGIVSEGEVNSFNGLDGRVVEEVTNLSASTGGDPGETNAQYAQRLRETRGDGSLSKVGGLLDWIRSTWPEALQVFIADAASPQMERDEIWTMDGVTPNLSRAGAPWAVHTALGTAQPLGLGGRVNFSASNLTSADVGKRVAIAGDPEVYRNILRVTSPTSAILSGYTPASLSGVALLWGRGPKIGNSADVYMYMPELFLRSTTVDRRTYLITPSVGVVVNGQPRIYVAFDPTRPSGNIPAQGLAVVQEGTQDELRLAYTSVGLEVGVGTYLVVAALPTPNVLANTAISIYPTSSITIAPDGDIRSTPLLNIQLVELLDPLTLEVSRTLTPTQPGAYAPPGWYVSATDGADVFSSKERKLLVIDSKVATSSYGPLNITGAGIVGSSQAGARDIVFTDDNMAGTEGRSVVLSVPERTISEVNATGLAATRVSDTRLQLTNVDYRWFSEENGRTTGFTGTITFNSTPIPFAPGDFRLKGNLLEPAKLTPMFGVGTYTVDLVFTKITKPSYTAGVVVARVDSSKIEMVVPNGLPTVVNNAGMDTKLKGATITAAADPLAADVDGFPVRVTYATHPAITQTQNEIDGLGTPLLGGVLLGNTLIRSYLPSLWEVVLNYRGRSTPRQIRQGFVDLLRRASIERAGGSETRIYVNNILSALDEEGLDDSVDSNIEIRVTNFLADGEFEVRYLNPSLSTKQPWTHEVDIASGETGVLLRRVGHTNLPPGRGKLIMGGNDPARREVIPYEAVVDSGPGALLFILRGGFDTEFAHRQWESVSVCVRDYDPELEYTQETVIIPSTCRPYIKSLIATQRS